MSRRAMAKRTDGLEGWVDPGSRLITSNWPKNSLFLFSKDSLELPRILDEID